MLLKMIEAAKNEPSVIKKLIEKREVSRTSKEWVYLITFIVSGKTDAAAQVENQLNNEIIVIVNNKGENSELNGEKVREVLSLLLSKDYFKVKREFTGTWATAKEAYNEYAKTHNVGTCWASTETEGFLCYEYLLEAKGEHEQQQIAKATQVAEQASVTAEFLGGERLVGTPKQQASAEQLRAAVLANADKKQAAKLLQQLSAKWWIDNKDCSIADLVKKRVSKAKAKATQAEKTAVVEEVKEAFTLQDQEKLIIESLNKFGLDRIKADLLDALLGNSNSVTEVLERKRLMTEAQIKSFKQFCQ